LRIDAQRLTQKFLDEHQGHSMATISTTTRHRVEAQGYVGLDDQTLTGVNVGLRFGPAVCAAVALLATWLASPSLFAGLALLAGVGVLLPTPPLDWLYNVSVRRLVHMPPLPATSRPRRFACLLASLCLSGAAVSFFLGRLAIGYTFGGLMVITPMVLVITGFCVPSFIYGLIFGRPGCPDQPAQFRFRSPINFTKEPQS
jgi:hypothetical protein